MEGSMELKIVRDIRIGAKFLFNWLIEWRKQGVSPVDRLVQPQYTPVWLTLIGTRFSPHLKKGEVKNTPEENLQYLGSLASDSDKIFQTV